MDLPPAPDITTDRGRLMDIVLGVEHASGEVSDAAAAAIAARVGLHPVEVEDMV